MLNLKPQSAAIILLKNSIVFPGMKYSFLVSDSHDKKALSYAHANRSLLFLVPAFYQPDADLPEKVLNVACLCKIESETQLDDGTIAVVVNVLSRASISSTEIRGGANIATVEYPDIEEDTLDDEETKELTAALITAAKANVDLFKPRFPAFSPDMLSPVMSPDQLCDSISANVLISLDAKETSLTTFKIRKRVVSIVASLASEAEILALERDIIDKVRDGINENQKNAFLHEQMRVIKQELGEDEPDDIEELYDRIDESLFSEDDKAKLCKEVRRMSAFHMGSPDYALLKAYVETCLELPLGKVAHPPYDIEAAKNILDEDHDGMTEIKERIIEFLSVANLKPDAPLQVLCLVGPPGTGKTSVARSIARAMDRKYVRVSLGGVRDESDIRGHRKTYVGAMPGRVINAFLQAKTTNPVILLDEVDKMGNSHNGDPASALLEVFDMEQNVAFRDHYIELPYDLSGALFIATANTLSTVPRPLLDRMEVIELHSYSKSEKLAIAKNHLIPKQLEKHGVPKSRLRFSDKAIIAIIDSYTKEAGVRNLERKLASVIRKAAVRVAAGEVSRINIGVKGLEEWLGPKTNIGEAEKGLDAVGVTNGLAYTEVGGDMLKIEACVLDGNGKLELTGSLGDVMKESAHIAISAIRQRADKSGIDRNFYKEKDIHIHVPEGAVPKDGPSAGVTIFTSLYSALTGKAVRGDVAMTGELTLTGRVLPIGGLKEKSMAAMAAGISTVLIPRENLPETAKFDESIRNAIRYIPCSNISDVIANAFAN